MAYIAMAYIVMACIVCSSDLRQSLPAAGIIEEYESARGEGGRVG